MNYEKLQFILIFLEILILFLFTFSLKNYRYRWDWASEQECCWIPVAASSTNQKNTFTDCTGYRDSVWAIPFSRRRYLSRVSSRKRPLRVFVSTDGDCQTLQPLLYCVLIEKCRHHCRLNPHIPPQSAQSPISVFCFGFIFLLRLSDLSNWAQTIEKSSSTASRAVRSKPISSIVVRLGILILIEIFKLNEKSAREKL